MDRVRDLALVTVAFLALTTGALAQAPGRYVQAETVAQDAGHWKFRVESIDVSEDKRIRVNLIVENRITFPTELFILDVGKIQLVSDSLERVAASGKPEGQFMMSQNRVNSVPGIALAPRDAVKIALKFPAFQQETKRVTLAFYNGGIDGTSAFQVRDIALFVAK